MPIRESVFDRRCRPLVPPGYCFPVMARPRIRRKDLPPGLYCYEGRSCYIQVGNMKPVPLNTQDPEEARAIYWEFKKLWDAQNAPKQAEALADRLELAAKGADVLTVAGYASKWRETYLPRLLKRNGKPISEKTRADYSRMVENQVETHEPFQALSVADVRTRNVRAFLARWIGAPAYYNYLKAVLSRMFAQAVDEGLLDANPISDVVRRATARREVVCPMADYLKITAQLDEWEARACDLIYLISHRPGDVLRLQDREPWVKYEERDGRKVVVVSFTATKNEQAMEIADDVQAQGGIEAALQWFRRWKEEQGIVTPGVVVFPKTARRQDVGRAVSRDYLSRRFAEAVTTAGFEAGAYTLRDLRKTGLTDEAQIAGEATMKGGHKTEQMRQYYVVGGVPQRVRNNLVVLRKNG